MKQIIVNGSFKPHILKLPGLYRCYNLVLQYLISLCPLEELTLQSPARQLLSHEAFPDLSSLGSDPFCLVPMPLFWR